jgi:hypothetical protein
VAVARGVTSSLVLALAAALVLVSGCSHRGTPSAPTTTTSVSPTPSQTPSSTTTRLDLQQAQARYLVLVVPAGEAITAYDKAIKQRKSWRTLRSYVRQLRTTISQEAQAVRAVQWPVKVQPAMSEWTAALIADAALLNRAAQATTETGFFTAAHKAVGDRSHAAEGQVRQALGL